MMRFVNGSSGQSAEICGTTKHKNMRFFALSFDKVILRFFLMMGCVIVGLFSGQPLLALLALPLFLSALLGVSFMPVEEAKKENSIIISLDNTSVESRKVA